MKTAIVQIPRVVVRPSMPSYCRIGGRGATATAKADPRPDTGSVYA